MRIRLLKQPDIPAAVAIVRHNFSREFARRARRELSDMFGEAAIKPVYLVAEVRWQVVGLVAYMQSWMDYNVFEIFWVNVAPGHQRQGIGKKLVEAAISQIKKQPEAALVLLTARVAAKLPAYYRQQFGFTTVQRFAKNAYHVMSLPIYQRAHRLQR